MRLLLLNTFECVIPIPVVALDCHLGVTVMLLAFTVSKPLRPRCVQRLRLDNHVARIGTDNRRRATNQGTSTKNCEGQVEQPLLFTQENWLVWLHAIDSLSVVWVRKWALLYCLGPAFKGRAWGVPVALSGGARKVCLLGWLRASVRCRSRFVRLAIEEKWEHVEVRFSNHEVFSTALKAG